MSDETLWRCPRCETNTRTHPCEVCGTARTISPALTPEEWSKKGGPLLGRFPLFWLDEKRGVGIPDAYEEWYADGRERHALAALCLYGMPFGFTREDVDALRDVSFRVESWDRELLARYEGVIAKLRALLPPEG